MLKDARIKKCKATADYGCSYITVTLKETINVKDVDREPTDRVLDGSSSAGVWNMVMRRRKNRGKDKQEALHR